MDNQVEAEPTQTIIDEETPEGVLRRIKWIAFGAYVVFAFSLVVRRDWSGLIALTCSAAVTMISFLWLEEIVDKLLQATPRKSPRKLMLRTLARFALLGVALSVTIFVARFNAIGVLLGFSITVVGIIGEAAYETYRSLAG